MDISALVPKDPIEIATPSGQLVKLKSLTTAGVDAIARTVRLRTSAFEFMTKIIHDHLIDPPTTLEMLRTWPKNDLDAIGRGWAAHDLGLNVELAGDDVPAAFHSAAEAYVKESAERLSKSFGGAFDAIRKQQEVWLRTMGTSRAIVEQVEAFYRSQEQWRRSLGFADIARAIQEQQRLASSLSSVRLVEEMAAAARAFQEHSIIAGLLTLG